MYIEINISDIGCAIGNQASLVINKDYKLYGMNFNQYTINMTKKKKTQSLRFFFDIESELISKKVGYKILKKYEFMSFMILSFNSRNVV